MEEIEVRVLLFSVLADRVGQRELAVSLPEAVSGGELLDHLAARYPALAEYRAVVRIAVNREYVPEAVSIQNGDEIALITPVSGG